MKQATRLLFVGTLLASARLTTAQCTNGAPPPCPAPRVVADRPLDERTWIVMPFSNVARAADLDWLSNASVNLLYANMSRWTDIRVVDDERVADLLRETSEASRLQLGLQVGTSVARRAGAARLVMGDLLKQGPRTAITAKVYDVRSGQRLRTVTVQTVGTDSLSETFDRLAHQVLAVPPPQNSARSGVGTSSVAALQAYTAGMQAYNRWRTDSALVLFRQALAHDSTFALAHLRIGFILANTGYAAGPSYAAAERFSGSLPERERLLIATFRGGVAGRCDAARRLVRLDSTDTDGWLGIGSNCYGPGLMRRDSAGRIQYVFSGNESRREFERALSLQPDNIFAFSRVTSTLIPIPSPRFACLPPTGSSSCTSESYFVGMIAVDHDTIVGTPFPLQEARFDPPVLRGDAYPHRRALLERARDLAAAYTSRNPLQWNARADFAYVLLGLGDLGGAERELRAAEAASQLRGSRRTYYRDRIELELRRERPAQAAALLDSMFLDSTASAQPQFATVFGRFSRDRSAADTGGFAPTRAAFMQGMSGVVTPDWDDAVAKYAVESSRTCVAPLREVWRQTVLEHGTMLGFPSRRGGAALDTSSIHPIARFEAFLSRGDTARARRELAVHDARVDGLAPDVFTGDLLFSAESHLLLADSAAALAKMRTFAQRWSGYWLNLSVTMLPFCSFSSTARLIPRAWLLYADLSMATGDRVEARRGYRMVVGMWEGGEAPVQPIVARARAALATLGSQ